MKFNPLVRLLGKIDTRIILIVLPRERIALFGRLLGKELTVKPAGLEKTKRTLQKPSGQSGSRDCSLGFEAALLHVLCAHGSLFWPLS